MHMTVAEHPHLFVSRTLLNLQKIRRQDADFSFTIDVYGRFFFSDQWGRVANPRYFYEPEFCRDVLRLIRKYRIKPGRFFLDERGLFRKGRLGERKYLR
jgi:hypothetical protein